ncbi:hypothetical protein P5673_011562 [Acropora cervicornis]|uniref:Uncharacterized protein n=1 Tax=Acropora cervicornis TaxID=6130 RepID=A0AAD9QPQ7_ACRCE|nr:hypothetical protein P5673_011562 [Acropora cervicornis]
MQRHAIDCFVRRHGYVSNTSVRFRSPSIISFKDSYIFLNKLKPPTGECYPKNLRMGAFKKEVIQLFLCRATEAEQALELIAHGCSFQYGRANIDRVRIPLDGDASSFLRKGNANVKSIVVAISRAAMNQDPEDAQDQDTQQRNEAEHLVAADNEPRVSHSDADVLPTPSPFAVILDSTVFHSLSAVQIGVFGNVRHICGFFGNVRHICGLLYPVLRVIKRRLSGFFSVSCAKL